MGYSPTGRDICTMSASLIGRFGSSAFRRSANAVMMSLADPRFTDIGETVRRSTMNLNLNYLDFGVRTWKLFLELTIKRCTKFWDLR